MKAAVLGVGLMGEGMAAQLLKAGFEVRVWNRTAARADALVQAGAIRAATPAQAAAGADIVIAMQSDDAVSRHLWLGPDGALAAMAARALAIDSGTLTPEWIRELGATAAAQGVHFLDAPVTGSKEQADTGTLRFLVGGSDEALALARPALDAMGRETLHCGPVGSGVTLKLVNNYLCGVHAASFAEAFAALENSGLDMAQAVGALAAGTAGSPMVGMMAQRMLAGDFEPRFVARLMVKDMAYADGLLAQCGVDSAIAKAAKARFADADAQGFGEMDLSAVVLPLLREKNGS